MLCTFDTVDDRPVLGFERRLSHPVDRVWRALTEPDELAGWFPSSVTLELGVGGRMSFTFEDGTRLEGEITELDPPRLLAFNWGEDRLRFDLEPADGGHASVLHLTVALGERNKAARDAAGWHVTLDRLERRLGGEATVAPSERPTDEWRGYYDEYARRGLPTGAPVPGG